MLRQCHNSPVLTAATARTCGIADSAFYLPDQILDSLREEFTPYGHFELVKGILQGTIRVQNIDFSQDLSQIDGGRRSGAGLERNLCPVHGLRPEGSLLRARNAHTV